MAKVRVGTGRVGVGVGAEGAGAGVERGNLPRGVYSELHLHLGGAILPNILYSYLRRQFGGGEGNGASANGHHPLLRRFVSHEKFEAFFAKRRGSLDEYLKMHTLVEEIQRSHSLRYFIQKLVRGAVLFDNLAYMELRYTPYFRTDLHLDEDQRIRQMEEVVRTVAEAAVSQPQYPLVLRQILCVHSRLSAKVNRAIVELAVECGSSARAKSTTLPKRQSRGTVKNGGRDGRAPNEVRVEGSTARDGRQSGEGAARGVDVRPLRSHFVRGSYATSNGSVVAIDVAGPDQLYGGRVKELVGLLKHARAKGLKTTGHVFETAAGMHAELLPHLDRIGHGIQIPLRQPSLLREVAKRGQCMEVCPTTYVRTGTLKAYEDLRVVLARCFDAGVPVAICTDNSGMHQVRLPMEFENLLVRDIIDFHQMEACHRAAFEFAFGWEGEAREL